MKVKLSEWAEREFSPTSQPSKATLIRMAKSGKIDGAIQLVEGGTWYVEVGAPSYPPDELLKMAVDNDPEMLKVMGL